MQRHRITFGENIERVRNGEVHPALLDMGLYSHLAALGRSATQDARIIELIVDSVEATEAYFTDLSPEEFFIDVLEVRNSYRYTAHPRRKQNIV